MPDYRTPGVYIEEISSGPRPVQASSTTETGMVAVITIPSQFIAGLGDAENVSSWKNRRYKHVMDSRSCVPSFEWSCCS